jgi:hypothetical protein
VRGEPAEKRADRDVGDEADRRRHREELVGRHVVIEGDGEREQAGREHAAGGAVPRPDREREQRDRDVEEVADSQARDVRRARAPGTRPRRRGRRGERGVGWGAPQGSLPQYQSARAPLRPPFEGHDGLLERGTRPSPTARTVRVGRALRPCRPSCPAKPLALEVSIALWECRSSCWARPLSLRRPSRSRRPPRPRARPRACRSSNAARARGLRNACTQVQRDRHTEREGDEHPALVPPGPVAARRGVQQPE